MAWVSDSAGDTGDPSFEGNAEGVRKKDSYIEIVLTECECSAQGAVVRGDGDYLIGEVESAPEIGKFFGCEDSEVEVGSALANGADGGDIHHRIAKPVAGTEEDAQFLQIFGRGLRRKVNSAFSIREQKLGAGKFPAVMNPEPVHRRFFDLFFEDAVDAGSEFFNGRIGRNFWADADVPEGGGGAGDGDGDDGCAGADGEGCCEGGSRC